MKFAIALLSTLALASTANAAVISAVESPTDGLPGFMTAIVSVETEAGESFRGVDATFTGDLNQVQAAGMDTPLGNLNAFIAADVLKDSQFLFTGTENGFLSIGVAETASLLKGAISGLANLDTALPNPAPFARLVYAEGSAPNIQVDLAVDGGGVDPVVYNGTLQGLLVPEPTSMLLFAMGLVGLAGGRRRS